MSTVEDEERERCRRNLRSYRSQVGMTQQQLATAASLSIDTIRAYEAGRRLPDRASALALARVFGVRMDDLFAADPPLAAPSVPPIKVTITGDVDEDLRRQIEEAINGINREHMRRVRHRAKKH